MKEPTGRDRIPLSIQITPGALGQISEFQHESGISTLTETVEAMIALAYAQDWPRRIRQAIRAQEAKGYRR